MRFAKLGLQRYGRFEDCELQFRPGRPDLHVIYGANEAGKSTSLAAVSDLLFGFQKSSPYDFRFDYSLMSVGAVLEDEGTVLECTRRKSGGPTLIDSRGLAIEQGILLAMLKGQTRDSFRLSFSLDQTGLRAGGRAMVAARDDIGQALFAAGSGLTRVSSELERINGEAEAIWGRRAKSSRTYTQAERALEAGNKAVRDRSLRPKTWVDARNLVESTGASRRDLEDERDRLLAKSRICERVRRIAGDVGLRKVLLERIDALSDAVMLAPQEESSAEQAMRDAEEAAALRAVAERLALEAEQRIADLSPDEDLLDAAADIERLVIVSGAIEKAARDLPRLVFEREAAAENLCRLRQEAGARGDSHLTRVAVAMLRDLVRGHVGDSSALREIAAVEKDLEARRKPLEDKLADARIDASLPALVGAIDDARRLGPEADLRCAAGDRRRQSAAAKASASLTRLAPWSGDFEALLVLRVPSPAELDEVKSIWTEHRAVMRRESEAAQRHLEEVERLEEQIGRSSDGALLSPDAVLDSRQARDSKWSPLRAHLLGADQLVDLPRSLGDYERASSAADVAADTRFAHADALAKSAALLGSLSAKKAEHAQAQRRLVNEEILFSATSSRWEERLLSEGLPSLEPIRMQSWAEFRSIAVADQEDWRRLDEEARGEEKRRSGVVAALRAAAVSGSLPPSTDQVAELLPIAERIRAETEEREQQYRLDRGELRQLEADATVQRRRRKILADAAAEREREWKAVLEGTGIDLVIASAEARLTVLDELRETVEEEKDLTKRITGIDRDAGQFEQELAKLADRFGIAASPAAAERLTALRSRLHDARSVSVLSNDLASERDRRNREATTATARADAGGLILAPLFARTATVDATGLVAAIQRSRELKQAQNALKDAEAAILRNGDGLPLESLATSVEDNPPDELAAQSASLERKLAELNANISSAAAANGAARSAFADLEAGGGTAVEAAADAEQARSELAVLAEAYILKRAQALTLRWAVDRYRERHQAPLLKRASELFATLTLGGYTALKVDLDEAPPRLLGLCNDGRSVVEVGAMSEGTTDQLFLALRLAALEQSVAAGVRMPFLADDLFVNFDDDRAAAGLRVLAELARTTQILFFTHHPHLVAIARNVVGADVHSECVLP